MVIKFLLDTMALTSGDSFLGHSQLKNWQYGISSINHPENDKNGLVY